MLNVVRFFPKKINIFSKDSSLGINKLLGKNLWLTLIGNWLLARPTNTNSRRRRSRRPNGKGNGNIDSSGPSVKVRGSARQVYDKYLLLARDAKSVGDTILSESYFQHAEHYARILIENGKFENNSSDRSNRNESIKDNLEKKTEINHLVDDNASKENGLDSETSEKIPQNDNLDSSTEKIPQN